MVQQNRRAGRRPAPLLIACVLVQAATGFVAPTKKAWRALRMGGADGGAGEDLPVYPSAPLPTGSDSFLDAVEGAVSELRAYTPEDGEPATQERLDAAEAEEQQPKELAAMAAEEASAEEAAASVASLEPPRVAEAEAPQLSNPAARRRALHADAQRVLERKAAEQAERDAAWRAKQQATRAEADARAVADSFARLLKPVRDEPKTPKIRTCLLYTSPSPRD